jgi:hypothetical protein
MVEHARMNVTTDWTTCARFAEQVKARTLTNSESTRFGKAATRRAKELNIELSKIPDARFGSVNAYPNSLLAAVWGEVFGEEAGPACPQQ